MINLSDGLQFLNTGAELEAAIQSALARSIEVLQLAWSGHASGRHLQAYGRMFQADALRRDAPCDEHFLRTAFELSQADSKLWPREKFELLGSYSSARLPPATGLPVVKRGLKLLLVELWRQRALLLPTVFTVGPGFPIGEFRHPMLDWVRTFDSTRTHGSADSRRMYYYGPRLLWATTWVEPGDVRIHEIASLTRARALHRQGKSEIAIAGGTQLPLSLFPAVLHRAFPDKVAFTNDDLIRLSQWATAQAVSQVPFEHFDPSEFAPRNAVSSPTNTDRQPLRRRRKLLEPNEDEDSHQVILRNFQALKGQHRGDFDWRHGQHISYPGREHVRLDDVMPIWIRCFRAYQASRQRQGYRSEKGVEAVLNLLADYLFFYLPWWKEIAVHSNVGLPLAPHAFKRFVFVVRQTPAVWSELPMTLLEIIRLRRRTNETVRLSIQHLRLFFDFIETNFSDEEEICGRSFKNPINQLFDAPRIETKSKTTKEIIPAHMYGYLLFWCYAVEDFGMQMAEAAVAGKLPKARTLLRDALRFNPTDFGIDSKFTFHGREYILASVPNVFTWSERKMRVATPEVESKYLPHCTVLRLLIGALETGLRAQSVQWLDRTSWRRFADGIPKESYTFPLLVNTDKTKSHSWITYVVHRVHSMLGRQEAFQRQFADADKFGPIEYEKTELSPFDSIQPLFRSTNSAFPVSDSVYDQYWRRLMVDFEAFYKATTGERHVQLFKLVPRVDENGSPVIAGTGPSKARPYCPISILAIHTPHSCRATFATNRKGILELSDASFLLGHSDEVVTAHYDKPDEAGLRERLKQSDLKIVGDSDLFIANSEVHVRADRPESSLVRSFTRNRKGTVQAFKFMPSIALWSTEDSRGESEGLKLLREGPMSQIRFRETHICPVGEQCPVDILEKIGEPRRCGACPLAMKCVDHLPAIAAKRNQLMERIRFQHHRRIQLEEADEPAAVLDEAWEAIELDVNELLGWQLSEDVLEQLRGQAHPEQDSSLHVDEPEVVKRHLRRVTRSSSVAEFMLQRIADSNAYPSLATPQVQLTASQIKRRLMAGRGLDTLSFEADGIDQVKSVAAMLALAMASEGLSVAQIAEQLSVPRPAEHNVQIEVNHGS